MEVGVSTWMQGSTNLQGLKGTPYIQYYVDQHSEPPPLAFLTTQSHFHDGPIVYVSHSL